MAKSPTTTQHSYRANAVYSRLIMVEPRGVMNVIVMTLLGLVPLLAIQVASSDAAPFPTRSADPSASSRSASVDGFKLTVAYWTELEKLARETELTLVELDHKATEAFPANSPKHLAYINSTLARKYPGAKYDGKNGSVPLLNNLVASFSQDLKVTKITDVLSVAGRRSSRTYYIRERKFECNSGLNSITGLINRENPAASLFSEVKFSAFQGAVEKIFSTGPDARTANSSAGVAVLNDAYQLSAGAQGLRMDTFAEKFLLTDDMYSFVLQTALTGYRQRHPSEFSVNDPSKPAPKVVLPGAAAAEGKLWNVGSFFVGLFLVVLALLAALFYGFRWFFQQVRDNLNVENRVRASMKSSQLNKKKSTGKSDSITGLEYEICKKNIQEAYRAEGYQLQVYFGLNSSQADLILVKDSTRYLVNYKLWDKERIELDVLKNFHSAMLSESVTGGIIISPAYFSRDARKFAKESSIDIVSENKLQLLLQRATEPITVIGKSLGVEVVFPVRREQPLPGIGVAVSGGGFSVEGAGGEIDDSAGKQNVIAPHDEPSVDAIEPSMLKGYDTTGAESPAPSFLASLISSGEAKAGGAEHYSEHAVADAVEKAVTRVVWGEVTDSLGDTVALAVGKQMAKALDESVVDAVDQAIAGILEKKVADSVAQPIAEAIAKAVSAGVDRPVLDAVSRVITDTVEREVPRAVAQSVARAMAETVAGGVEQPVAEAVSRAVAASIDNQVQQAVAQPVSDAIAKAVAAGVEQPVLDAVARVITVTLESEVPQAVAQSVTMAIKEAVAAGVEQPVVAAMEKAVSAGIGHHVAEALQRVMATSMESTVSEAVAQPVTDAIQRAIAVGVAQPVADAIAQAVASGVEEPVTNAIAQAIAVGVERPVADAITLAIAAGVEQPVAAAVSRAMATSMESTVSEAVAQPVAEAIQRAVAVGVAQPVADAIAQAVASGVEEPVTNAIAQAIAVGVEQPVAAAITLAIAAGVEQPVAAAVSRAMATSIESTVSEAVAQPVAEAIQRAVAAGVVQPVTDAIAQAIAVGVEQPVAQAVSRTMAAFIESSVSRAVAQPVADAVARSIESTVSLAVAQPVAEAIEEAIATGIEQPVTDAITQTIAAGVEQPFAEAVAQAVAASVEKQEHAERTSVRIEQAMVFDCTLCGKKMRVGTVKKGANAGKKFWVCSDYPSCRNISPISG